MPKLKKWKWKVKKEKKNMNTMKKLFENEKKHKESIREKGNDGKEK